MCALAPSTYKTACDNIVTTYLPYLINYVEQNENPDQACTSIGLCSSSSSKPAKAAEPVISVKITRH